MFSVKFINSFSILLFKMGRIKTQLTKRIGRKLMDSHPEDFKRDFKENKEKVEKYLEIASPKLRNMITGHVTRLAKNKSKR